jgi:hypothetical protein
MLHWFRALDNTTASNNTAVGYNSLCTIHRLHNTAVGRMLYVLIQQVHEIQQ